jgi:hypothetical protein
MLDTGCWISRNAPMVKSEDIEYPETRIQDQSGLAKVFLATM